MTEFITILIAVISATGAGLGVALLTRKKTLSEAKLADAQAAQVIVKMATEAARELIGEYQKRLESVELELESQARAIEELNGQLLRYRLIVSILMQQIRLLGRDPALLDEDIEGMPIDELRRVARLLKRDN